MIRQVDGAVTVTLNPGRNSKWSFARLERNGRLVMELAQGVLNGGFRFRTAKHVVAHEYGHVVDFSSIIDERPFVTIFRNSKAARRSTVITPEGRRTRANYWELFAEQFAFFAGGSVTASAYRIPRIIGQARSRALFRRYYTPLFRNGLVVK
jgi:hypothetical protein